MLLQDREGQSARWASEQRRRRREGVVAEDWTREGRADKEVKLRACVLAFPRMPTFSRFLALMHSNLSFLARPHGNAQSKHRPSFPQERHPTHTERLSASSSAPTNNWQAASAHHGYLTVCSNTLFPSTHIACPDEPITIRSRDFDDRRTKHASPSDPSLDTRAMQDACFSGLC